LIHQFLNFLRKLFQNLSPPIRPARRMRAGHWLMMDTRAVVINGGYAPSSKNLEFCHESKQNLEQNLDVY
jgi:hypothetical protein